jgi:hypothetical protein
MRCAICLTVLLICVNAGGPDDTVLLAECSKKPGVEQWGMRWAHVSSPNIPANSSFVVVDPKTGNPTLQCLNVEAWGRNTGDRVWATVCHNEGTEFGSFVVCLNDCAFRCA